MRPVRCGTALLTPSLPSVWQLNALRVEDPDVTLEELVDEAEELQGRLGHRQLFVPDTELGARLAPELARLGWNVSGSPGDAQRREPGPSRAPPAWAPRWTGKPARACSPSSARAVAGRRRRDDPPARGDGRSLHRASSGRATSARPPEGPYSCCRLLTGDGIGQIDQVCTLGAHRNRGHARAAVLAALDAAAADGARSGVPPERRRDWPQHLYRRLGFEPVDIQWEFLKLPLDSTPP